MARAFSELFVNRLAYPIQSTRPHPESGRHYYYRPKGKNGAPAPGLTVDTVRRHLAGELTIGIYAINPETQRCKWMAIDADYRTALEDLIKVQRQLQDDGVAAALEKSKRGGHLWMFFDRPVLARDARIYIYHLAAKLNVQVKSAGLSEGIEIFPKQDELKPDEFGNAIRAPLGVHWGAREGRGWRYWFLWSRLQPRRPTRIPTWIAKGEGRASAPNDRGQGDSAGICTTRAEDRNPTVLRAKTGGIPDFTTSQSGGKSAGIG
jgi:hypothetical protein